MRNADLRRLLAQFPDELEVMPRRGEWGPCRITEPPSAILVELKPDGRSCWECYYPDLREPDDPPLATVIVI